METNPQDGAPARPISEGGGGSDTETDSIAETAGAENAEETPEAVTQRGPSVRDFLVVGIGASAGGLAALERFFDHVGGKDPGMAFVVVVHLSPEHESNMASLLQGHTRMPVTQVTERVRIASNNVYVIPPGKQLSMDDGDLRLSEPDSPRGHRAPIDLFFRTLAETHGEWSAAVVLSGTGSDGSIGLPMVKEMGGVTFAQAPEEAQHNQMPNNAIATGFVDYVLPAADMATRLRDYSNSKQKVSLRLLEPEDGEGAAADEVVTPGAPPAAGTAAQPVQPGGLNELLALLLARIGHDFTSYKRSTLMRRIERRMQINNSPDLGSYLEFFRTNPSEAQLLLRDLLVSVTNFFRDKDAWAALELTVIPAIFRRKEGPGSVVRVWVAGCATGEEAYSLANQWC